MLSSSFALQVAGKFAFCNSAFRAKREQEYELQSILWQILTLGERTKDNASAHVKFRERTRVQAIKGGEFQILDNLR